MAKKFDWDQEAVRAANHAYTHMMQAHRGAFAWKNTAVAAIFGNDGYTKGKHPFGRYTVEKLRESLDERGVEVLGFGLNDDEDPGYSWAMLVRMGDGRDVESLNELVWDVFMSMTGPRPEVVCQRMIGRFVDSGIKPSISSN